MQAMCGTSLKDGASSQAMPPQMLALVPQTCHCWVWH